ncbi:MAG: M1 family metallopeptidase [Bacteroidetes bacterium]|nr:M1 family metallopeptidase [Bacteroidota bacterium]
MQKMCVYIAAVLISLQAIAQDENSSTDSLPKSPYQATATKINDLVHTKLDVKFDFSKSYLYGKAWITLKPHFYPTDSLQLDAKGMDIKKVSLVKGNNSKDLKYKYDGWFLKINLDKTYKGGEEYTVYIDYTSKPNEVKVKGSAAINEAKGLYFINPLGKEKDKPTEVWTQGETEGSSVWFPTIDRPNQKSTEEIYMTVPDKYVTLSNGKLTSQKKNADGTRTDYWKMDLPHAPYLFFMGVGDFAIVKDSYKGKEVSYYVDKPYASVARKIFGNTPEMMGFYSKILGIEYPWVKYSQMVGRDYVSGAMENTTATLHQESAQKDARELTDENAWESTIAHELFHQWFGDLVTTESWSNLTLNESFANYSEVLWNEYKYGKDAGDEQNYKDMEDYLRSNSGNKDLVRFYYNDKEDMFDAVSYNKGGRILHMLRNYVGDSAFFKALNLYLTTNKFKSAEATQLRLAFEDVTGRDLNWYWNQWYYGAGNPSLDINYSYDNTTHKAQVIVKQVQEGDKIFKLPVAIDIYKGAEKKRYNVWVENKTDTFYFDAATKPDLINFDGDKILLTEKKENKTLDEYIHQYKYASNYVDRREAIDFASEHQEDPKAVALLKLALKDKYDGLRKLALNAIDMRNSNVAKEMESTLIDLAKNDPKKLVKAAAIENLRFYQKAEYAPIFKAAVNDSSYTVAGNALAALEDVDNIAALAEAKRLSALPAKGRLASAISTVMIEAGDESSADLILNDFEKMPFSQGKIDAVQSLAVFIAKAKNTDIVKRGVDAIAAFRDASPESFKDDANKLVNEYIFKAIAKRKTAEGLKEQADYILSKIPSTDSKKGF